MLNIFNLCFFGITDNNMGKLLILLVHIHLPTYYKTVQYSKGRREREEIRVTSSKICGTDIQTGMKRKI